jgi:DNA gyrase subunit A
MGRSSHGVNGLKLDAEDSLAGVMKVTPDETMLILTEHGYGKRVAFEEFSPHGRATGGQKVYTISEKTGGIVGCVSVLEADEIMCVTEHGKSIRVKASTIRVMGRAAQGVRVLNLEEGDRVVGVDRIAEQPEAEE